MRSYKIKNVSNDNKKKLITIEYAKGELSIPYSKLMAKPSAKNKIAEIYVDSELENKAITYVLESGAMDSVPLDAFLDFNKDSDYLREVKIHKLTVIANRYVEDSGMSKREICRRMNTSLSQLSRLLDTTNSSKTFDQLIKLFNTLGTDVKIEVLEVA